MKGSRMSAKLIAEEGILKGLILDLEPGDEWVIGRDPDECQLLIEDPSASRKHLVCRKTPTGIVAENLSDTNPLQVNNVVIQEPIILKEGDELRIGDGLFRFHNGQSEKEPDTSDKQLDETEENAIKTETSDNISEPQSYSSPQDLADGGDHDTLFEEEGQESGVQHQLAEIHFDLADSGRWLLKVVSGPNNGAEFSMKTGTSYVLGNEPSTCDIILQDVSVSRQHMRLSITEDNKVYVEDLGSSNGTIIDQQKIEQKTELAPNTLVTLGTTTIAVIDTEGERHTIISPLLPSIANILKQQEEKKAQEAAAAQQQATPMTGPETVQPNMETQEPEESIIKSASNLVFIATITGVLLIASIGITFLFQSKEVTTPKVDIQKAIQEALANFPAVKFTYNTATGRLFLSGHVLTNVDRNQVLYNLQSLTPNYVKAIDNSIIVDEVIWQEFNQIISRNTNWKGVNIHAPNPGHFILSGYLKTRQQSDSLADYMGQNFPFINLLQTKINVEEDIANEINQILQEDGFRDVQLTIANGEVTLNGNIAVSQTSLFNDALKKIKSISGVRTLKNFIVSLQVNQVEINISSKYSVSGSSRTGGGISVVINGNILSLGDYLEGMKIIEITPSSVILQKDEIKYRIDY